MHRLPGYSAYFIALLVLGVSVGSLRGHLASTPLPEHLVNQYPFSNVGVVTAQGYRGSGAAIGQKVVLTCAHVFFNDSPSVMNWLPTSTYGWNLQHSVSDTSPDMYARSYRYFVDYADAVRRYSPGGGNSSYEEFNLDVVCLIFYQDVARGGWSGWWQDRATVTSYKMIVGYPAGNYSTSDSRRNMMHATGTIGASASYTFVNYNDRMGNTRRVYQTHGLSSGKGNSGGPVFSYLNDGEGGSSWFIIGVHVGGSHGSNAIMTAIDSSVASMIRTAIDDTGGNITVTTPVITSATQISAEAGSFFSYTITADHEPSSFGASNLPSGLAVNTTTGVISGILDLPPGTYAISLRASNSAGTGTLTLELTVTAPVVSDPYVGSPRFAQAPYLPGPGSYSGNSTGAGADPGEPAHDGLQPYHSVWWKWVATQTARVTVDTFGSDFDTILVVYRGGPALTDLIEVAYNDDAESGYTLQSEVEFDAVAGITYYFVVDGYDGRTGSITLNLHASQGLALPAFINPIHDLGSWIYSYWFGFLYVPLLPWAYHQYHGWLYLSPDQTQSDEAWYFDSGNQMGWVFIMPDHYPWLWSHSHQEWLRYDEGTRQPRRFSRSGQNPDLLID